MPKISALPPITTLATDDENPAKDTSAGSTGKWTFATLKTWLQSLTGWITNGMLASSSVDSTKIDWAASTGKVWWQELARVSATTTQADLDSGTFTAKKYLKIIFIGQATGGTYAFGFAFNGDTANNYADALIYGSGTSAGYSQTASRGNIRASTTIPSGGSYYFEAEIINVAAFTKQFQGRATSDQSGTNATYSPDNQLFSGKWVNAAAQITSIKATKLGGTSGMGSGAQLIILGHD